MSVKLQYNYIAVIIIIWLSMWINEPKGYGLNYLHIDYELIDTATKAPSCKDQFIMHERSMNRKLTAIWANNYSLIPSSKRYSITMWLLNAHTYSHSHTATSNESEYILLWWYRMTKKSRRKKTKIWSQATVTDQTLYTARIIVINLQYKWVINSTCLCQPHCNIIQVYKYVVALNFL